jgi:hypothetical protein
MNIERMRQLSDSTLKSLYACSFKGKEPEDCATVLRERGYKICGFGWSNDQTEKDSVEEMRKKIYSE